MRKEKSSATARHRVRDRFTPSATTGMRCTDRDARFIVSVFESVAMTGRQGEELGIFASASRRKARLRLLFDHGFVRKVALRSGPFAASYAARDIFIPGPSAVPVIAAKCGLDPADVRRRIRSLYDGPGGSPPFLEHALLATDVRVAFAKACQREAAAMEWVPEGGCRREYEIRAAAGASGGAEGRWKKVVFAPDGAVLLPRTCLYIEADAGSQGHRQIGAKVGIAARFVASGLHAKAFPLHPAAITVFVTAAGEGRARNLAAVARAAAPDYAVGVTSLEALCGSGPFAPVWFGVADDPAVPGLLPVTIEGCAL